jgi:hypothetical protein
MAAALGACAQNAPHARELASGTPQPKRSGAYVIDAKSLQEEQRTLLEMMRLRFPTMEVQGSMGCPLIQFRGRNTLFTRSDPAIYLDGQRAANTCILEELTTMDLALVEVYPSGIPRPGYRTNANGVIIIFVRKGEELFADDSGATEEPAPEPPPPPAATPPVTR